MRLRLQFQNSRALSSWAAVPEQPFDPILGLVAKFKLDEADRKVNWSVSFSLLYIASYHSLFTSLKLDEVHKVPNLFKR